MSKILVVLDKDHNLIQDCLYHSIGGAKNSIRRVFRYYDYYGSALYEIDTVELTKTKIFDIEQFKDQTSTLPYPRYSVNFVYNATLLLKKESEEKLEDLSCV